jgi:hypothetical protein
MAELLSQLSIISYIVAGVFLTTAIVFFVAFRIPKVFSDLTGRTAKKSIKKIRANNELSGYKSYRPSKTNRERGKVTETIPQKEKNQDMPGTGIISDNKADKYDTEATGLLKESTVELREPIFKGPTREPKIKLKVLEEVLFVHTDEVV